MPQRDDFLARDRLIAAGRVGVRCSNPVCRKLTSGPADAPTKAVNIGVAAHISAESPGGPRYNPNLTPQERRSIENAIWLCQSCSRIIDVDSHRYQVGTLRSWRNWAEQAAQEEISGSGPPPAFDSTPKILDQPGAVLLPDMIALRSYRTPATRGLVRDFSVYPFLLQELVSVGATIITVLKGSGQEKSLGVLSSFMRRRVRVIDPTPSAALLRPLFEPIEKVMGWHFEFAETGEIVLGRHAHETNVGDAGTEHIEHGIRLHDGLLRIIWGMQHQLQIDLNLAVIIRSAAEPREALSRLSGAGVGDARDLLAIFNGVLSSYRQCSLGAVQLEHQAARTNAIFFQDLLGNSDYQRMGQAAHDLGEPASVHSTQNSFADSAHSLLGNVRFGPSLAPTRRQMSIVSEHANERLSPAPFYSGYRRPKNRKCGYRF